MLVFYLSLLKCLKDPLRYQRGYNYHNKLKILEFIISTKPEWSKHRVRFHHHFRRNRDEAALIYNKNDYQFKALSTRSNFYLEIFIKLDHFDHIFLSNKYVPVQPSPPKKYCLEQTIFNEGKFAWVWTKIFFTWPFILITFLETNLV